MMPPVPNRSTFENAYAGQAPWDIGRPQKAFLDVADRITGSVLDAGCGTGENALYFAVRGCKVTSIDFLEEPISRAKLKTAERGVTATFLVMDALALKDLPEVFDSVIDSGLFHIFNDEFMRLEGVYLFGVAEGVHLQLRERDVQALGPFQVSGFAPAESLFLVEPGHELFQHLHHVPNRIRPCWPALLSTSPQNKGCQLLIRSS
jgi:SAM-dependent methyltransferase